MIERHLPQSTKQARFIRKATARHGGKYNYEEVVYIDEGTNVTIRRPAHGPFQQSPHRHLRNSGCPFCAREKPSMRRRTTASFVEKAVSVHGRRYDYSPVAYTRWNEPVTIVCRVHGPFRQQAQAHYRGAGCPRCARIKQTPSGIVDTCSFIEAAKRVHGDTYDYSLCRFRAADVLTAIVCSQHGTFAQRPSLHIGLRNGCPVCARENRQLTRDQFLQEVSGLYAQEFDYSLMPSRVTSRMKITVICPEHGEFGVSAAAHRRGSANCPDCKRSSRFERMIARILDGAGIRFETQWSHPSLRHKTKLRFDFMLPRTRTVIEYNRAFHHKPIQMPGQTLEDAVRAHHETLVRDEIKNLWAERNRWTLIRLSRPHRISEDLAAAGIIRFEAAGKEAA